LDFCGKGGRLALLSSEESLPIGPVVDGYA
jgi:hypothetical protein